MIENYVWKILARDCVFVNLGVDVVELVVMTFEDTDFIIWYCDVVICTSYVDAQYGMEVRKIICFVRDNS